VDQNRKQTIFVPLSNRSNVHFWSNFEIRLVEKGIFDAYAILNTFLGQKLDPAYNFFILYKSTDDDDINLGKPVQQKVQPLKAPNSRNLPSRQRQIIIDDFSSSSSEDEQPNNREEDEDVCAGVGTSMLYPYSGDDTILETPERAPKVPGQNSIIFYKKFLETKCLDTN